jgi:hypothetical protein
VLPQVLAGLGLFSVLSAGCVFWLERLQPFFFAVAIAALIYQAWIVKRQPPSMRTWSVKGILAVSLTLNVAIMGAWIVVWFRYR